MWAVNLCSMLDSTHNIESSTTVNRDLPVRLSSREVEVLRLMADGIPDVAVAKALGIRPSTVRTYIARLRVQFQVVNRAQLGAIAARQGYGDEDVRMVI